jgi:hypothetical protein
MHCGKNHRQSWTGEKSVITPACQNSNAFQWSWSKHFHFDLYIGKDGQNIESRSGHSITIQGLSKVRQQIEDEIQVMEEAARTVQRTVWLPFLKGQHLAHLGYIARLSDHSELELQTATDS